MLRIVRMTIGSRNHPRYLLSSTVLQVPLHTPQDRVGQAYVRDVGESSRFVSYLYYVHDLCDSQRKQVRVPS